MDRIGACGDNCDCCPRYFASVSSNPEALVELKDLWVRLGFRNDSILAESLLCFGCRSENKCAYSELRNCVLSKKNRTCGDCTIYPCSKTFEVFDKTSKLMNNCKKKCSENEFAIISKAFFNKKENLDQIFNLKFRRNMK